MTALVVHNQEVLRQVLDQLRASGRRVPADISVVAVSPRDVALSMPIPLTSVDIAAHDVGGLAVETAMKLLDGSHTEPVRLPPPTLVERESCARRAPDSFTADLGLYRSTGRIALRQAATIGRSEELFRLGRRPFAVQCRSCPWCSVCRIPLEFSQLRACSQARVW